MVSDDLTAFAAISMGALASAAVTLALTAAEPESRDDLEEQRSVTVVALVEHSSTCSAAGPTVDFAIIRSGGDGPEMHLMVGPEGVHSGWKPERNLQLRLPRER
jgi:hypothetical protein